MEFKFAKPDGWIAIKLTSRRQSFAGGFDTFLTGCLEFRLGLIKFGHEILGLFFRTALDIALQLLELGDCVVDNVRALLLGMFFLAQPTFTNIKIVNSNFLSNLYKHASQ